MITQHEVHEVSSGKQTGWNMDLYIPDNIQPGAKLPLFLFNTGNGEIGAAETDRKELYYNGPLRFIKAGWKPDNMIIGACQSTGGWAGWPFFHSMLHFLTTKTFPIDHNRLAISGLSGGAHACLAYAGQCPSYRYIPIHAMVPMGITPPAQTFLSRYADIFVWGFGGNMDSHMAKLRSFVNSLPRSKFTTYIGGHDNWNKHYDPNYREAGKNIYEKCLEEMKGGIIQPPAPENPILKTFTDQEGAYDLYKDFSWKKR
jgi:hypothetical protein